jgi:DNA-binding protein HU-beta
MNKQDLVDALAKETGLTKVDLESALNAMMRIIQERVKAGDDVTLMGFGTFSSSVRKARQGHDPYNGVGISIPEMTLPRFKAGKEFKAALNKKS